MFGWLTRRDGRRGAKAARRLTSPRGSVFSEFALVMPLVALVCSALIEIVGYWDAQVMANHAAWQVGRIAMVRGTNGLAFSNNISETGIKGTEMPKFLQTTLKGVFQEISKFNNRGAVATMMLMSTCGIGYYGASPGKTLSVGFSKLCDECTQALKEAIEGGISGLTADFATTIFNDMFSTQEEKNAVAEVVRKAANKVIIAILTPVIDKIAESVTSLLMNAFNNIFGKEGSKIDSLFSDSSAAARNARQIFGAASRISRAAKPGVVRVSAITNSVYAFAAHAGQFGESRRLAFPQVADSTAASDGFFVTGAHGWPANNNVHAMVHVEIDWPYEQAWLFPVVSGRGGASSTAPLAKGHSMVFPQPNIVNANLYSKGATQFDPGSYQGPATKDFSDLADEIRAYLKRTQFCMRYRIGEEKLTLYTDGPMHTVTHWKYVIELHELWPFDAKDADSYPVKGDYGECWDRLAPGRGQETTAKGLAEGKYFTNSVYRAKDYFYWNGAVHRNYRLWGGRSGLDDFYKGNFHWYYYVTQKTKVSFQELSMIVIKNFNDSKPLTYADDSTDLYCCTDDFDTLYDQYVKADIEGQLKQPMLTQVRETTTEEFKLSLIKKDPDHADEIRGYTTEELLEKYSSFKVKLRSVESTSSRSIDVRALLKDKISKFANRNKVNVPHIVKWQEGSNFSAWAEKDKELAQKAKEADDAYGKLKSFIRGEIGDIDKLINGGKLSIGDENNPVLTDSDMKAIEDPQAAVKDAQDRWYHTQTNLTAHLKKVDQAVLDVRNYWDTYRSYVDTFREGRKQWVARYFTEVCVRMCADNRSMSFLDQEHDASFSIPAAYQAGKYNIVAGTDEMYNVAQTYYNKVDQAYQREMEYGYLLGLKSAGAAKREGKTLDQAVGAADEIGEDKYGTLEAGSDSAEILDDDEQVYRGGKWRWK